MFLQKRGKSSLVSQWFVPQGNASQIEFSTVCRPLDGKLQRLDKRLPAF